MKSDMAAYRKTLYYLYHFTDYAKRGPAAYAPKFYNLDRVRHLLTKLGNPQQTFQAVHIAGTKGKGSTSAMIESILRRAGYRTGLYTSPHLHSFRERIQAGGELISEADVIRLADEMRPLLGQIEGITTFEVMTGLAFAWFAEQQVEWAIVEVGLGGRLDATNVLTPAVAVITSISFDHTAILGDTLAQIAGEKAGIVKPGVPIVSAAQADEALSVIKTACREQNAPLTLVGRDWTYAAGQADLNGQSFTLCHGQDVIEDFWIPLLGQHQLANATTAMAAVNLLQKAGLAIPELAIRKGLRRVRWPGRLEILNRAPFLVSDSAHNGDSAQKLVSAFRTHFDYGRLIIILGASPDHATPELLEAFLSAADLAIATQTRHPRAAAPDWLQDRAAQLGYRVETSPDVSQALDLALEAAAPDDLICCTGSVFVAAEARAEWFARQGMPLPPVDPT